MRGQGAAGHGLARYVPAVTWLGGHQSAWLRGDLVAGSPPRGGHRVPRRPGAGPGGGVHPGRHHGRAAAGCRGAAAGVPGRLHLRPVLAGFKAGTNWPTFVLALASIALLLGLRRRAPPSLPGPLLVVALGILLAAFTGLADRGVALVGAIPPGLPQFAAPDLSMARELLVPAAGLA